MNFNNKVIVITGASSGIGEEFIRFAKKGAKVVLAVRREETSSCEEENFRIYKKHISLSVRCFE